MTRQCKHHRNSPCSGYPFVYVGFQVKKGGYFRVNKNARILLRNVLPEKVDVYYDDKNIKLIFHDNGEYAVHYARGGLIISTCNLMSSIDLEPFKRYMCSVKKDTISFLYKEAADE